MASWLCALVLAATLVTEARGGLVAVRARAASAAAGSPGSSQAEATGKLKKDLAAKLGDSFDADYVLDRPTTVPSGYRGPAIPVGTPHDLAPDEGFAPAAAKPPCASAPSPAPGPAPCPSSPAAPAPGPAPLAPGSWSPFTEDSLPDHVQHGNMETALGDWRHEFGAKGPQNGPHSPWQTGGTSAHFGQPRHGTRPWYDKDGMYEKPGPWFMRGGSVRCGLTAVLAVGAAALLGA